MMVLSRKCLLTTNRSATRLPISWGELPAGQFWNSFCAYPCAAAPSSMAPATTVREIDLRCVFILSTFREKLFHLERMAHHIAYFVQRLQLPGAHRLHQRVAGRRRFHRSGHHPPPCDVGRELVEQAVPRAAAHNVNHIHRPPRQTLQRFQNLPIPHRQAGEDRAAHLSVVSRRLLPGLPAMLANLLCALARGVKRREGSRALPED